MRAALCGWYSRSGSRFRKHPSRFPYRWELALRAAPEHGSVRAAPHRWWYSHNGSRYRKHPSQFPYRWGLLLRDASDHAVQAAPHRWYSRSGSRLRKRSSRFPYSWGLLHRDAPNRDYLGLFRRIPRRIFRRFCLWCRWAFRYRRYVPLNTKHCHRCGSSGIQLHKPYDCSNHIFCIRGSHVSPYSHSGRSASGLFLPL